MIFTVVLLALFAERFLLEESSWRQPVWVSGYLARLEGNRYGARLISRYGGILLLLAPPLLLLWLLQDALSGWFWDVPEFLFALLVLLYCLGPDDLDSQVLDYLESEERGDEEKTRGFAERLCQCEPEADKAARVQQLTAAVLAQSLRRIFAVVFWFLLLGPAGALLYRLAQHFRQVVAEDEAHRLFNQGTDRLIHILDWLPARLVVYSFALAGSFEGALQGQRDWRKQDGESAEKLLVSAGRMALGLSGENKEAPEPGQVEAALSLVWRALTLWLVVLAFSAITF